MEVVTLHFHGYFGNNLVIIEITSFAQFLHYQLTATLGSHLTLARVENKGNIVWNFPKWHNLKLNTTLAQVVENLCATKVPTGFHPNTVLIPSGELRRLVKVAEKGQARST